MSTNTLMERGVWKKYADGESESELTLYIAWSQWGTYRGCCSRRDGARTSG